MSNVSEKMPVKNRPSRRAKSDKRMADYIESKERAKKQQDSGGGEVVEEAEYCFCGADLGWPRARPSECSSHFFHKDCLIQWATRDGDIPNKKTCPLCRKDFRNIKMQSNIGGQEVLVEVNQPVNYVAGGETLAPSATDQQVFPDWSLLRRNTVRQTPHTLHGYPG